MQTEVITNKHVSTIRKLLRQKFLSDGLTTHNARSKARTASEEYRESLWQLNQIRQQCPYLLFEPYKGWQEDFFKAPAKIRVAHCGNQTGKSMAVAADAVWQMYKVHPWHTEHFNKPRMRIRVVGYDVDHTIQHWLETILSELLPKEDQGTFNRLSKRVLIPSMQGDKGGESHFFEFMTYGMEPAQFASVQREITIFDEVPPRAIWDECWMRTVATGGTIMIAATPAIEGGSSIFFRELVRDLETRPNTNEEAKDMGLPETMTATVFCGSMYEAAKAGVVDYSVKDVKAMEERMPHDQAQARVHGKLVNVGGYVYPEYTDKIFPEGHLFKADELWPPSEERTDFGGTPPADGWQIVAGLDPSINGITACVWGAINRNSDIYIFQEYYEKERPIPAHAKAIKAIESRFASKPMYRVIDPAAKQKQGVGEKYMVATIDQYNQAIAGDDKRDPGFQLGIRDEIARIDLVRQMLMFVGENKKNKQPRLFIAVRCKNLRNEIMNLSWQRYTRNPHERNPKQTVQDYKNHATDALSYMAAHQGGVRYMPWIEDQQIYQWQRTGATGGHYRKVTNG